jgi:hypothetical protein
MRLLSKGGGCLWKIASIQRFKYTFEIAWKLFKKAAEKNNGDRDCVRKKGNIITGLSFLATAARADVIIIAWGKAGDTSKAIQKRQEYFLEKLDEFADKMQMIGFHPLAPRMRVRWKLESIHKK